MPVVDIGLGREGWTHSNTVMYVCVHVQSSALTTPWFTVRSTSRGAHDESSKQYESGGDPAPAAWVRRSAKRDLPLAASRQAALVLDVE